MIPGTRVERFINEVTGAKVIVPLSGMPISCDGEGHCKGPGEVEHDHDEDHDHDDHDHH